MTVLQPKLLQQAGVLLYHDALCAVALATRSQGT
jgi:hypothetical protein